MIPNYWYIGQKGSFTETRAARIGASSVSKLFPNPEKPTESLAGYDETALTFYNEMVGDKKEFKQNLAAEMGHPLENKSIEFFVRQFFGYEMGVNVRIRKEQYENDLLLSKLNKTEPPNPELYQVGLFRHNTEYYYDGMIVHLDLIYLGDPDLLNAPKAERYKTVSGIIVDFAKPFYLEGKSARKESAKRRVGTVVKGYDFELTNWQGIPLKHFVQMQFQSAIFQIDTGYLPLIHNTSEFQVWKVDRDKKWQKRIINIVGRMLKHIELRKPPKEMAICMSDIVGLYPTLKNDFKTVTGESLEKIVSICKEFKHAKQQIKNWTSIEKDCKDALSVYLADYDEIKDGSSSLVKWKNNKGRESIGLDKEITGTLSFLKYIKLNDKVGYNYIVRKGWLKTGKPSRSVDIKYKP